MNNEIPDFQSLMLPTLRSAATRGSFRKEDAVADVAEQLGLSPEARQARLAGGQTIIGNRVGWALSYMKFARLVSSPERGAFEITDRGREVVAEKPERIDMNFLGRYPEYVAWRRGEVADNSDAEPGLTANPAVTPEEAIDRAVSQIKNDLATNLLEQVRARADNSVFFENLVVDLLLKMGYGGSFSEAGEVVGKTGDGGIDGVIKQDRLGLEKIYVQAKNWQANVGGPDLGRFVGGLAVKRAKKGVFVTTSGFTKDALEYAAGLADQLVLVDGRQLASLMIEYGVGVAVQTVHTIKRLDGDYFSE